MAKLWDKGKNEGEAAQSFLSRDLWADQNLVKYDCIGSIAHAKMLHKIGILNKTELEKVINVLKEIIELDKKQQFILNQDDEDVHSKIENYLVKKLGTIGKKIHTYRSRNDQILLDTRLYNKEKLDQLFIDVKNLIKTLLAFAKVYEFSPMPGYTHRQKAMLSSVGLWAGSFIEALLDDLKFLKSVQELNNQCPLGSAASYGVPKNIYRQLVSDLLGFKKVQNNSMYCQLSRGKIESAILSGLSQIMITLSRLSADIIIFSTSEFDYFKLGDDVTTGSSIMPQKKNPDVPETIKGYANTVIGYENIIKTTIKDLPSGYNKETKIVKKHTMQALIITQDCVNAMNKCIKTIKVNKKQCEKSCTKEIFAADYAYELVEKGMAFRDAYKIAAKKMNEYKIPNLLHALKKRSHLGGTGNLGFDELEKELNKC